MSRPQEPNRPFFHFGNPFRMIPPKSSQLSPRLLSLLNTFEATLSGRLEKLVPKDKGDILSLSWMKLAMESLSEIHCDIKNLITELDLPVTDWDEKWMDVYLDISVKLLDISNAFTSELTRLNQGHLMLQFVLHKLESDSPEQFTRASSSLDSWKQHISSKNPRVETCRPILDNLVESLNLPKVRNSSKGKVLMRAMYGAKVATTYICSVFAAAFSGSSKNLLDLTVPNTLPWAQVFSVVQTTLNVEIRNIFSCGEFTVLRELEAVDACVKKLFTLLQVGVGPSERESFKNSVSDLRTTEEKLAQGLDNLSKAIDSFFKVVLTGRDALLCNLRKAGDAAPNSMIRKNVKVQPAR
ncbi:Protein BPS1 [Hibiscus syriacus]|uniref:Protein BPS1 n=1 Tax=Hibiscus syriacus TaxID=106335 RepID=A0A6A3BX39_HIBSY|nr:protein BPS1, chloroplastic-like [Hibiscus syriacus]XP_039063375.1 protein BPS1, chloroplastic-like [Hibiscus syriacus]XP_039063678.1 protein BPS1, chloroplastic-like [Hibiscus syriacus]XP_039063679.1 protein BPS1, chloroplastic-like [Hibiscus syriacus]KAE8721323.1 Protein BPS1 [Hibiscus syriacus]KAE8721455.1 Protein BPS1 [Hibiscus syriacus]